MNQRHWAWDNQSRALCGEIKSRPFLHLPGSVRCASGKRDNTWEEPCTPDDWCFCAHDKAWLVSILFILLGRCETQWATYGNENSYYELRWCIEMSHSMSVMSYIYTQSCKCKWRKGKCPLTWTLNLLLPFGRVYMEPIVYEWGSIGTSLDSFLFYKHLVPFDLTAPVVLFFFGPSSKDKQWYLFIQEHISKNIIQI